MNGLTIADTLSISGSATGNVRNKVSLKPGRGIMDWVRLGHTENDLSGTGGKLLQVTPSELAKHNTSKDAWIVLKGKVYNLTPYFEYHPGGEDELMKGVGTDATSLFNEVHKWVNFSTMLKYCLVGTLVEETSSFFSKPNFLQFRKAPISATSLKSNNLMPPPGNASITFNSGTSKRTPKFDWFQTKEIISIAIYTKWKIINSSHIFIIIKGEDLKVIVYIDDMVLTLHWMLHKPVEPAIEIKITEGTNGKVDLIIKKIEYGIRWTNLGDILVGHQNYLLRRDAELEFLTYHLSEKVKLSHNTYLYVLKLPSSLHMRIPFGFHVYLRVPLSENTKPYSPVITPFMISRDRGKRPEDKVIEIFFRVYDKGEVSSDLEKLSEGDEIEVSLPEGSFTPLNLFEATVNASHLVLLGAGTGIAPLIKLMLEALKNGLKVLLVTFNKTEIDIPWKVELDSLVVTQSKLRVTHVLSQPSESWQGLIGRISLKMLESILPIGDWEKTTFVCVCGSKGFNSNTAELLEELGHVPDEMFIFDG